MRENGDNLDVGNLSIGDCLFCRSENCSWEKMGTIQMQMKTVVKRLNGTQSHTD